MTISNATPARSRHILHRLGGCAAALLLLVAAAFALGTDASAQGQPNPNVRPPANAVIPGGPGVVQPERPGNYDIEMWKKVREGIVGQVSIPDKKAGTLVQSDGEAWRNFRNGPLPTYGAYGLAGVIVLLALFFLIRGRIKIDHGWAGYTIVRFNTMERFGHWLLATSFVILGLTGLNVLYGRYVLLPVLGPDAFSAISIAGKWIHNYVAFSFMLGLVLTFVLWVANNFPSKTDLVWLLKGGGMFVKGSHPPSWKFNAGQKILFWLVMLSGVSLSLSGIALLFPFQTALFAKTFALVNVLGFNFPTQLTPIQEMQYATSWHSIVALVMMIVIIAHIYIGTIGMQGAFDAMGSGEVDANWAKEHHSLWAEQELRKMQMPDSASDSGPRPVPAE